jgi:hypothetical protein
MYRFLQQTISVNMYNILFYYHLRPDNLKYVTTPHYKDDTSKKHYDISKDESALYRNTFCSINVHSSNFLLKIYDLEYRGQ